MATPLFFAPPGAVQGESIILPKTEAHHARTVLRLKKNSQVIVVDGLGRAFRGTIAIMSSRKDTIVEIQNEIRGFGEPFANVTLAAGLSEGFKFDEVVQKCTELGIKNFVPLVTEKSKIKMTAAAKFDNKLKRLKRVALGAMKQSRRSFCPQILPIMKYSDFLNSEDEDSCKIIFHPVKQRRKTDPGILLKNCKKVTILIGPESGFSDAEVESALEKEFSPISLGERILRTENAGPVTCALVMYWLGELS
ncbi:MAG: RsmE family RNA methyltransferase [candidate division Zixibacteria bacterium]